METYFDCPYKGFASRGLRLQEREERTVMATDTGNFMHAVLETAARSFSSLSSEEECRALAGEVGMRGLPSCACTYMYFCLPVIFISFICLANQRMR